MVRPHARPPARDLLDGAVAAGVLTREQAAAVAALDTPPTDGRRGAVLAEVLGYVRGALAVAGGPLFADDGRGAWLVGILVAGLALVAAAVVLTPRAHR